MNRQLKTIIIILIILVLGLIFGFPFEFLNTTLDRIVTIIIEIVIILLFIKLFLLTNYIDRKVTKWLTIALICIVTIPYLFSGIMTTLLVTSRNYPMWQDVAVYTKPNGEKIISQWRETSGSIYDFRCRKILADFGQIRISFYVESRDIKGIWTKHLVEKDSTFTIDLDKNIVDYCN
jgi:hypothetical protein